MTKYHILCTASDKGLWWAPIGRLDSKLACSEQIYCQDTQQRA